MTPRKKWLFSIVNAFVLLAMSLFWLHSPYTYGDEKFLIKWSSVIRQMVFQQEENPAKKDFLFINLAYEKALIPVREQLGNEVITDRAALARFFTVLKRYPVAKYTFCDVYLKGTSASDSLLVAGLGNLSDIIFPTELDAHDRIKPLVIKVPSAVADYTTADDAFLKFSLFREHYKTIPLVLYEDLQHRKIEEHYGLYWDNDFLFLNTIIIDYKLRTEEVFGDDGYTVVNLSELLLLPDEVIATEFLKDRIVILGDFDYDRHKTLIDNMPGSLILLNVYLSLMAGNHIIGWGWILFMLAAFTLFSKLMVFNNHKPGTSHNKWALRLFQSATLLAIVSLASYFFFSVVIQVLFLALYTSLLIFIKKIKAEKAPVRSLKYWLNYLS